MPSTTTSVTRSQVPRLMNNFPTTAHRQRSSNINVDNPELEFMRTALTTCRSTISQQETELKRLKESLDIRNKRITQLEQQIGFASDNFSTRNSNTDPQGDSLAAIRELLDSIVDKMKDTCTAHPTNNIVVNTCQAHTDHRLQKQNAGTQTHSSRLAVGDTDLDLTGMEESHEPCVPPNLEVPNPTL